MLCQLGGAGALWLPVNLTKPIDALNQCARCRAPLAWVVRCTNQRVQGYVL